MLECPHCGNTEVDRFRAISKTVYGLDEVGKQDKRNIVSECLKLRCTACRRTAANWSYTKGQWLVFKKGSTDKKKRINPGVRKVNSCSGCLGNADGGNCTRTVFPVSDCIEKGYLLHSNKVYSIFQRLSFSACP